MMDAPHWCGTGVLPPARLIDDALLAEIWRVMPEDTRAEILERVVGGGFIAGSSVHFRYVEVCRFFARRGWGEGATYPGAKKLDSFRDALCGWFIIQARREAEGFV